jgi:hypothetical protein
MPLLRESEKQTLSSRYRNGKNRLRPNDTFSRGGYRKMGKRDMHLLSFSMIQNFCVPRLRINAIVGQH